MQAVKVVQCTAANRVACRYTPRRHGLALSRPKVGLTPGRSPTSAKAQGEPGDSEGGEPRRRFITKEEEPDEYWTSKAEREGESPMKDPMAWFGLLGIFFPFVILGIAVAVGYVDLNP